MQTTASESVPLRNANPNGRPPFEPTAELRRQVEFLARIGLPHHKIAQALCISPTTLRKHFREPLKSGALQAKAEVTRSLFDMATKGRNTSAAIFYAKTRCGFHASKRVKNPSANNAKEGGF
jgi:hypothetical protein